MSLPIRGFVTPGWTVTDDPATTADALRDMTTTGANSAIFDVALETASLTANEMSVYSPSELVRVEAAMREARAQGIDVWLKPVLNHVDPSGAILWWQGLAPSDPAKWFQNYQAELVGLATVAQRVGASHLLLTNELFTMTSNPAYAGYWQELITAVRSVYSGEIGFNAGGMLGGSAPDRNEFLAISDALYEMVDFVGISAYPRLSSSHAPTAEILAAGWTSDAYDTNLDALMQQLFARNDLPVYFTEMASPPYLGGNFAGEFLGRPIADVLDLASQKLFYDTVFAHIEKYYSHRVEGVFVYDWTLNQQQVMASTRVGQPFDWSIADKPARADIQAWYSGQRSYDPVYWGGIGADLIHGGTQNDVIHGGRNGDALYGGLGDDLLLGNGVPQPQGGTVTLAINAAGAIWNGEALRAEVQVNGRTVGVLDVPAVETYRIEGQPWNGPATYLFELPPGVAIESLHLVELNWGGAGAYENRSLYIHAVTLDGVQLPAVGTLTDPRGNALGNAQSLHADGWLALDAGAYNQRLLDAAGDNDWLDGGSGTDTAVYAGRRADFTVEHVAEGLRVTDRAGPEGTDTLVGIERLRFDESRVALDLNGNGNAGWAARLIGTLVGNSAVADKALAGEVIGYVDAYGVQTVTQMLVSLGVTAALAGGADNASFFTLLYKNVVGSPPPATDLAELVSYVDSGAFTQAQALEVVAGLDLTANQIGLAGLAQTGWDYVEYSG